MTPVIPQDVVNSIRNATADPKVVNINIQINNNIVNNSIALQEQPILQRYSRNSEFSISSLVSLMWHVGILAVLIGLAFYINWKNDSDMPIETVTIGSGGGGGNPDGVGDAPGGALPLVEIALPRDLPSDAKLPTEPLTDAKDPAVNVPDLLKDVTSDPDSDRELAKVIERGSQAISRLAKVDPKTRDALGIGKGKGGPGSGGGAGTGAGPDTGSGDGAIGNIRVRRNLRWTILFNTTSGQDYLRQLDTLGAILAVRHPDGELRTIRKLLERPAKLDLEDVKKLNRINWIDNKRETVEQLANALGLSFTPPEIIALFPYNFEKELVEKEKAFRGRKEEEIQETRFQILMRAAKTYQIIVVDQRYVR